MYLKEIITDLTCSEKKMHKDYKLDQSIIRFKRRFKKNKTLKCHHHLNSIKFGSI